MTIPDIPEGVTWAAVQRFADERGIGPAVIEVCLRDSLTIAAGRVMVALHRERLTRLSTLDDSGPEPTLVLGTEPQVRLPLDGPSLWGDVSLSRLPVFRKADLDTVLTTADSFLTAIRTACHDSPILTSRAFESDFLNSLANLVLNRLAYDSRKGTIEQPAEPVWVGHTYYPFPGLRLGPSVEDVATCNNLDGSPAELSLLIMKQYNFYSADGTIEEHAYQAWSGRSDWEPGVIPIHPWQKRLSEQVRAALSLGLTAEMQAQLSAYPLASQRTLRIVKTGYDVKLAVNAVLTGELRLLFTMNVSNAPVVSALIESLRGRIGLDSLEFQTDMASLAYDDPVLAPHLAAILRHPLHSSVGERIVPALSLWANSELATSLFRIDSSSRARDVFSRYCYIVLSGPLAYYGLAGIGFEPHLQNSLVRVKDDQPVALILRDLDGSILDPLLSPPNLSAAGLTLPMENWDVVPDDRSARRRLMHSLLYAHLGPAASYLVRNKLLDPHEAYSCVERVWESEMKRHTGKARQRIEDMHDDGLAPKLILTNRIERRMELAFRDREWRLH